MSESNLIPIGNYPAVATRVAGEDGDHLARFGFSKTDTKQVLVYFRITDGPYKGAVLPWFGFFTEKTWQRTVESFRICGLKGDDLALANSQALDNEVSISVGHNRWTNDEGQERVSARVDWVNRPGSGSIKLANPMTDDAVRQFAAQMRTRVASVKEEAGSPAAGAGSFGGSPAGAKAVDDIPF